MKVLLALLILCGCLGSFVQSADVNAWKQRVVYQVLTDRFARTNGDLTTPCNLKEYCGGNFDGIAANLDYIKDMGFDAIWISPTVDNMEPGYHGYWFRNFEKVNNHFGDEVSLKRLVDTAHSKGMFVMVDVVANHVAPVIEDFSTIYPFNQASHYHKRCPIYNWEDQLQVENCRLCDLPDLDQANPYVRKYLVDWIKNQISKYGFDGIRIDTVPHIEKTFWTEFTKSAGVFSIGEVFNGKESYLGIYQQVMDSLLNYPMYFTIKYTWTGYNSMRAISERWGLLDANMKDVDALGLFVDNHDNQRFLHINNDWRLLKAALAFSLTGRGIPFMYYGSEQGFKGGNDPENREPMWNSFNKEHEIYKFVQTVLRARKTQGVATSKFSEKYVDDHFYVFTRGTNFIVALTNDPNQTPSQRIGNLGIANGTVMCNIFKPAECATITGGAMDISLTNCEVKIYVPKSSSFFVSPKQTSLEALRRH